MSEPASRRWLPSMGNLVVTAGLLLAVALSLTLGMPHWRKLQLLQLVDRSGGLVRTEYVGPERYRDRFGDGDRGFFTRITDIRVDDVDDAFLSLAAVQPRLRVLSVSGREISSAGVAELGAARSLRELLLIDARLTDEEIVPLGRLVRLEELRLPHNAVEGTAFRQFSRQCALRKLDLTWCPVTDTGLRSIARLENLESLDLSGTAITSRGLMHLEHHPALATLNLYGTGVDDDAVPSLARIPRLEMVVLMDTHVTERGRQQLLEFKPHCRIHFQSLPLQ